MKKIAIFSVLLAAAIVGIAAWFSPLALSDAKEYKNNEAVSSIDGFVYPADTATRVDYTGSEEDMYRTLDGMLAVKVASAVSGGSLIVYAYSPRVAGKARTTGDGRKYNVMAAYRDGKYAIGTPVLQGSF